MTYDTLLSVFRMFQKGADTVVEFKIANKNEK